MIWTVMPENMVINESSDFPQLKEVTYGEKKLLCYPIAPGKMCIFRILSSNPADYLNAKLQPGNVLDITQLQFK